MIRLKKGDEYDSMINTLCQAVDDAADTLASASPEKVRGDVIDTLLKALDLLEVDGVGIRSLLVEACESHASRLLHQAHSPQGGVHWDRKDMVKRSRWLLDVADLMKGKV